MQYDIVDLLIQYTYSQLLQRSPADQPYKVT